MWFGKNKRVSKGFGDGGCVCVKCYTRLLSRPFSFLCENVPLDWVELLYSLFFHLLFLPYLFVGVVQVQSFFGCCSFVWFCVVPTDTHSGREGKERGLRAMDECIPIYMVKEKRMNSHKNKNLLVHLRVLVALCFLCVHLVLDHLK